MWKLDHNKGWAPKNWCFWTVVLEKTLDSPLDIKEIRPVNPKGNQPWIFIGRNNAEVEASIIWSPDSKSQFIGKDPDARKDWRQDAKGMTEDRMIGWHFTNSMDMSLSKLREIMKGREAWCAVLRGVTKSWTWLSDWTTATTINHNGKEYKEKKKKLFLLIRVNICRWDQCLFPKPKTYVE